MRTDQVLIRDKKRGRDEEGEEESRMKKEQEEGMKMVKRKNYRKALDRALRRGWEAFITNLYSVTLTACDIILAFAAEETATQLCVG
ncbi:hypothetical protein E3U43_007967 [Larimichthys crocea]|uniref:Uncharacterized protein n=1 Tax=Larimichthys crocea TaxID=215358 RepID=A0ACD3Q5L8_LARCR|nr:hypothetical protein E3U43_007967 [Larimichthys crocea]